MIATKALLPQVERELMKRSLLDYAAGISPGFDRAAPHVQFIAGLFERVNRGELSRVAITAPPGHGKSTLTQLMVSHRLGSRRTRVLMISATQGLGRRNSRDTRSHVTNESYPWSTGALESEAIDEWQMSNGSGVRAIGYNGTVTGFRAELIVVDDLQPDQMTPDTRDQLESWFRGVLMTRLEPGGAVVVIQTRWGTDDLVARLLDGESGADWTHFNLQAICDTEDDPIGRKIGEALWPKRWPVAALLATKREIGTAAFDAEYMGNPTPEGGLTFSPELLSTRYESLPQDPPPVLVDESEAIRLRMQRRSGLFDPFDVAYYRAKVPPRSEMVLRVMGIDCASMTGVQHDYSVLVTVDFHRNRFYIADVVRAKLAFTELLDLVRKTYEKNRPSRIFVEQASNGIAIVQALQSWTQLPVIPVPARGSKISRVESLTPLYESGRVVLPQRAPWLEAYVQEFLGFPGGRHDDQVDATAIALTGASEIVNRQRDAAQNAAAWTSRAQR